MTKQTEIDAFLVEGGDVVLPDRIIKGGAVLVSEGRILSAGSRESVKEIPSRCRRVSAEGGLICPPLWEPHIHGCGGVSTENASADSLLAMGRFLARRGVGAFLPTTVANEGYCAALGRALGEAADHPELKGRIPGFYVEGPFISAVRRGGIPDETITPVSIERLDRLLSLSGNKIRVMTYAPELKGAAELASALRDRGVLPSMGHSDARIADIPVTADRELVNVTHLYNGMSGVSHKEPGLAQWALLSGNAFTEITCDGVHVHDAAISLALRLRSWERIILISDAMPPAGLADEAASRTAMSLYGRPVEARGDGVYYADSGVLVGSRRLVADGIVRLVSRHQVPLARAVGMATLNPARLLGFTRKGALLPDYDGDVAVLSRDLSVCSFLSWEGSVLHGTLATPAPTR